MFVLRLPSVFSFISVNWVCFWYFRGCPRAYHPSCVNRDEAFFRAKGRWNCGKLCYVDLYLLLNSCYQKIISCVPGPSPLHSDIRLHCYFLGDL